MCLVFRGLLWRLFDDDREKLNCSYYYCGCRHELSHDCLVHPIWKKAHYIFPSFLESAFWLELDGSIRGTRESWI